MLTESEKHGASALLRQLSLEELLALAKTVTNNQITLNSKEEAVEAIVSYSLSGVELLKRRKLKRDHLFSYLFKENVSVDAKAGKLVLAQAVLSHWGTNNVDMLDLMEIGNDPPAGDARQMPLPDIQQSSVPRAAAACQIPSLAQHSRVVLQNNILPDQAPALLFQSQQQPQSFTQQPQGSMPPATAAQQQPSSWLADFLSFESTVQSTPEDEAMGLEFSRWFYRMLNSCHAQGQPCETQFGTQHFFPDAILKVLVMNTQELQTFEGSDAICEKCLAMVRQDSLLFNANVDVGGVKTISMPHGPKVIIACGTLHKGPEVVGVFAQQFGLVRNPQQDFNWNIKYTNLKLVSGTPNQPPTLDSPGTMIAM